MSSIEGVKEAKKQLRILDERLGKGVGAAKERAHLRRVIDGTYDPKPKKKAKAKALKDSVKTDAPAPRKKQPAQIMEPNANFDKKLTAALRSGSHHGVEMKTRAERRR